MRCRCALVAGLLAGVAPALPASADDEVIDVTAPSANDARDAFGIKAAPFITAPCADGLAFECALATDPLDDNTPYALSTWLPVSQLLRLPVAGASHDAIAGYALGAGRDGAGPVFGGATGLDNRWTIDGAPGDSLRTGAVETRIPLAFLDGMMVSAGGFSARDRASVGGTIDARLKRGTGDFSIVAGAWTSLSLAPRERPSASGSYTLRRVSIGGGPELTASLVATDRLTERTGGAGTVWYVAGIAPSLSSTPVSWRAARLVDADGDSVPDGLPGEIATTTIEQTRTRTRDYFVPVMGRLGYDLERHHVELTLLGEAQRESRFAGNATEQAAGIDRATLIGDAIATWHARWQDIGARIQLAWHHSARSESAHDPAAAGIPQLLTTYVPTTLPDDPVLAAACDDRPPMDQVKTIANCPVPFAYFASGGAGPLISTVGDRPSITIDLAGRVDHHVVRFGFTAEDSHLSTTTVFTGGEQDRSLFDGELSRRRFFANDCGVTADLPCNYTASSELSYRALYSAAYVEDTWSPTSHLAFDAGLRWELMWVGTQLHFSNQLAPRLGVVWDPLGGGRSRLWASYGRTFAMLPAGLGTTMIQRDATVDDFSFAGTASRNYDAGAAFAIAPGVQPVTQDEATLGAELALAGALRATLWGQARWLRHGLDVTSDRFGNPGSNGEIAATRETELVAFSLEMRRPDTAIRAGVSWGRAVGTWTGPYDPRQGVNFLQTPDWSFGARNLYGPLPTDQGGRMFLEAERRTAFGSVELAVATRVSLASGTPRSALASGDNGVVELVPRGSLGRNPLIAQTNLRLAARWSGITATLDIINLFDRRDPTNLDETYSGDTVHPIQGGSYEDLVFLKTDGGGAARRQTTFQLPIAFQPPLQISLGIHKAF